MLLVIVGKTGVGKDTVSKSLYNMGYKKIVTYTTRPKRQNETDGEDYRFISKDMFSAMKSLNFFADTTSFRAYNNGKKETWHYGLTQQSLVEGNYYSSYSNKGDKVLIVNPSGLKTLRKSNTPMLVFHVDLATDIIRERLEQRGDSQKEVNRRLKADAKDFKDIDKYVDFKISNDGTLSSGTIATIINTIFTNYKRSMNVDRSGNVLNSHEKLTGEEPHFSNKNMTSK